MNEATIIGHLGGHPDLRYTANGQPVVSMRIATNEKWKDAQGQKQQRTEWHTVVVWGGLAKTCAEYLSKGDQVLARGRMQHREWTDKENVKRTTCEIVAEMVTFLRTQRGGNAPTPTDQDAPF